MQASKRTTTLARCVCKTEVCRGAATSGRGAEWQEHFGAFPIIISAQYICSALPPFDPLYGSRSVSGTKPKPSRFALTAWSGRSAVCTPCPCCFHVLAKCLNSKENDWKAEFGGRTESKRNDFPLNLSQGRELSLSTPFTEQEILQHFLTTKARLDLVPGLWIHFVNGSDD